MTVFRNNRILNLIIYFLPLILGSPLNILGVSDIISFMVYLVLLGFSGLWYYSFALELNKIDGPKMPIKLISIQCTLFLLIPILDKLFFKPFDFIEGSDKIVFPFAPLLFPINGFILIGILIFHLQAREKKYLKIKETDTISDVIQMGILPFGFFRVPQRIDKIFLLIKNNS